MLEYTCRFFYAGFNMENHMTTTKADRLIRAISTKPRTVSQLKKIVANPSAHVSYLRNSLQHQIVTSERNGKTYYGFWAA